VSLPEEIEIHRDRLWRRDPEYRIEDVYSAERFLRRSGFVCTITPTGPSLFVAVVEDGSHHRPGTSVISVFGPTLKAKSRDADDLFGKCVEGSDVYFAFLISSFNSLLGCAKCGEQVLSKDAQAISKC
jgi:hypothetical protein